MVSTAEIPDNLPAATEIRDWLEWAGVRLIALPGARVGPKEPGTFWPEYAQDKFEVLQFRAGLSIKVAAPSAHEIPMMEEILALPALCKWIPTRRILHMRALLHPLTYRHLYMWSRIAKHEQSDPRTVKAHFERGLKEVSEKVSLEKVCRIRAFLLT